MTAERCVRVVRAEGVCHHRRRSPMLTQARLEHLIRDSALKLTYYFDPLATPPGVLSNPSVDPTRPDAKATQAFHSMMFGERLGLTMGPLLVSHTYRHAARRKRYGSYPGVYDLRESDGQVELRPGESATVNTIERVSLDGSLAAVILPRLSHATAGLVLTPSYIDPYWDGLLVLHLVNLSRQPHTLRFGERIAVCRFYEVDGDPLGEDFRQRFIEKSHHYGQSWERVLSSDADPFPMRKRPTRREDLAERIAAVVRSGLGKLAGAGVGLVVVIGIAVQYGRLEGQLGRVDRVDDRVSRLADSPLARARAGQVNVQLGGGAREGSNTIALENVRGGAVALAEIVGAPAGVRVSAAVEAAPAGNGARLVLRVHRSTAAGARTVAVRWVVL